MIWLFGPLIKPILAILGVTAVMSLGYAGCQKQLIRDYQEAEAKRVSEVAIHNATQVTKLRASVSQVRARETRWRKERDNAIADLERTEAETEAARKAGKCPTGCYYSPD